MAWYVDRGVRRWRGEFPEPTDEELAPYMPLHLVEDPCIAEKCGSWAGYKAHRARGETPCTRCRDVINESCRRSRAKRRERERAQAA